MLIVELFQDAIHVRRDALPDWAKKCLDDTDRIIVDFGVFYYTFVLFMESLNLATSLDSIQGKPVGNIDLTSSTDIPDAFVDVGSDYGFGFTL